MREPDKIRGSVSGRPVSCQFPVSRDMQRKKTVLYVA
jgi:hypothetical protein